MPLGESRTPDPPARRDGGPVDELVHHDPTPGPVPGGPGGSGDSDARHAAGRRREQRAWYFYDVANSAYVTTTATVLLAPFLTAVAERAACAGSARDCGRDLSVLGIPVSPGSLVFYAATSRRCCPRCCCRWWAPRSTGRGASAPSWPASPGRARRQRARCGSSRAPAGSSASRCSWSPTCASRPRSSSTTRCCAASPPPTSATGCPAAAGRWATSAGSCCSRSTWPSSARTTPSGSPRARPCGGACSAPGCGGPASRSCRSWACATSRRPSRCPAVARWSVPRSVSWRPRCVTCGASRTPCASCSRTCSSTTASRP